MREIKFRKWSTYAKRYRFSANYSGIDLFAMDNNNESKWQQYTGLKDKNGVEIYEGDIVEYQIQAGKEGNTLGVVKWYDILSSFRILNSSGRGTASVCQSILVKGHIHQNTDLLKDGSD